MASKKNNTANLTRRLTSTAQGYVSEVKLIGDFIHTVDRHLERRPNLRKRKLSKEDGDQFRAVGEAFLKVSRAAEARQRKAFKLDISPRVASLVLSAATSVKHRTFLAEMCLAYLVS